MRHLLVHQCQCRILGGLASETPPCSSVSVSDLSVICFIRSSGKQLGEKSEVLGDNWTTVPNLDGFDAPLVSSSSDAYLRIQVEVYSASNLAS